MPKRNAISGVLAPTPFLREPPKEQVTPTMLFPIIRTGSLSQTISDGFPVYFVVVAMP